MDSEEKFQSTCFQKHWNYYPEYRKRLCCINNNSQNALKGAQNRAIGVISGVSDMFYLLENGKIIWLEFKIPGGRQSENQKQWQSVCENLGHEYRLIFNEFEFWNAVNLTDPLLKKAV